MRLLRIEITGFKSFCDKTVIQFVQDGISIVVGPNGCGKSNIVDAVRWTLGAQSAKHLRGSAMEDVIFNGSSVRQPVSLAQVNLVFTNPDHNTLPKYSEFSEISVTRRLYRSGESQYLINKTPCRLTDIRELFMDTGVSGKGYSIIEQGKIDQIVTSRAEDRRMIIDEAAGIVKFKSKRKDAERKFATTKQNLLRVEDILAELHNQEETLKFQVEKAEEYLHAKGRLERLQQCILAKQWYKLNREADRLSLSREKNLQRQTDRQLIVTDLSVNESALNLDIERALKAEEDQRTQLQARKEEIIKLESKLEADNIAKNNLDEWEERGKEEIVLLQKQIQTIEFQTESHQTLGKTLTKEIEQSTELVDKLEELEKVSDRDLSDLRLKLEKARKEQITIISELASDRNQISQLENRQSETQTKKDQINAQISNNEADISNLENKQEQYQYKLQQIAEKRGVLQEKEKIDQKAQNELQDSLRIKTSEAKSLTEESLRIQNRHSSLKELIENHEEFDGATKKLLVYMEEDPVFAKESGFLGTLADLITTDKPLNEEISALLNRYFNLLIFQSVEHLERIIQTAEKLGAEQIQAYFMDMVEPSSQNSVNAFHVRFFQKSSKIEVSFPLANSYQPIDKPVYQLSRNQLQKAEGLIDPSANIMTPEKIFLIGSPAKSNAAAQYFQRRSELSDLESQLGQLNADVDSAETELKKGEERLVEMVQTAEQQKQILIDLDMANITLEKEVDGFGQELTRLSNHLSALQEEQNQIENSLENTRAEEQTLTENIAANAKRQQELQLSSQNIQLQIDETAGSKQTNSDELQQLRINLASLEEKQSSNRTTLERLTADLELRKDQLVDLNSHSNEKKDQKKEIITSIKSTKDRMPVLLEKLSEQEQQLKRLSDKTEENRARLLLMQNSIATEQHKINQIRERTHKQDIRLAQLNQETKNLSDNLYTEERITPQELLQTFDVDQFDIEKETENINVLKQQIGGMEDINLAAKKEYDTLVERIEFLTTQSEDLNLSIKTLEDSINKINQESKRRFRETFNKINIQFGITFPQLFGGGEAFLKLTDEDDMLETGVDIIARPPGKKLQNMSLLSGGEKALTAIALVFSIFQIKPSPFCLLDEVDAPLDDANNTRFNLHVKNLTTNSQFIIITHNKKTMEIGNALFGVTMEEPGISKVVSVELTKMVTDSLQKAG